MKILTATAVATAVAVLAFASPAVADSASIGYAADWSPGYGSTVQPGEALTGHITVYDNEPETAQLNASASGVSGLAVDLGTTTYTGSQLAAGIPLQLTSQGTTVTVHAAAGNSQDAAIDLTVGGALIDGVWNVEAVSHIACVAEIGTTMTTPGGWSSHTRGIPLALPSAPCRPVALPRATALLNRLLATHHARGRYKVTVSVARRVCTVKRGSMVTCGYAGRLHTVRSATAYKR